MHKFIGAVLPLLLVCAGAPGSENAAHERLRQAAAEMAIFNFSDGYRLFQQVQQSEVEGSAGWQEAVFGSAVCAHQLTPAQRKRVDEAEALYRLLLHKTPQSRFAARAMMNLGRLLELRDYAGDIVDTDGARQMYQEVIDRWPAEAIAGEATLRIAATYVQTYDDPDVRRGVELLETWLRQHPDDPLASAMHQYLGDTYFYPLNNPASALRGYEQVERLGWTDPGRQGPIYWRMAVLAERRLNDPERAAKYYGKIITETPNSGKAYQAQEGLRRLGKPVPPISVFQHEPEN